MFIFLVNVGCWICWLDIDDFIIRVGNNEILSVIVLNESDVEIFVLFGFLFEMVWKVLKVMVGGN